MNYEFDFENIGLTEEQNHAVQLGIAKVEDLSEKIKLIINRRAQDGWEPLYPFSVPLLWFKRIAVKKGRQSKGSKA